MKTITMILVMCLAILLPSVLLTTELPKDVQIQILQLRAEGKFADADTLEIREMAMAKLEEIQAKAQKEEEAKLIKAQKEKEAGWNKELLTLKYDEVFGGFCVNPQTGEYDIEKIEYISRRYSMKLTSKSPEYQIAEMRDEIERRQEIKKTEGRMKEVFWREIKGLQASQMAHINELERLLGDLTKEVKENSNNIELQAKKIKIICSALNDLGVNTEACLNAISEGKNGESRLNRALKKAEKDYVPIDVDLE